MNNEGYNAKLKELPLPAICSRGNFLKKGVLTSYQISFPLRMQEIS